MKEHIKFRVSLTKSGKVKLQLHAQYALRFNTLRIASCLPFVIVSLDKSYKQQFQVSNGFSRTVNLYEPTFYEVDFLYNI